MFSNTVIIIILLVVFLLFFFLIKLTIVDEYKKRKNTKEIILSEVTPKNGILVDILFCKIYFIKRRGLIFYDKEYTTNEFPISLIIKDLEDNKLYILFGEYNFGEYNYESYVQSSAFNTFFYSLKSIKGKSINIGDKVKFYKKQELGKFRTDKNNCYFAGKKYRYYGTISNFNPIFNGRANAIFNVDNENFLDLLEDIIPIEGIVDFDI